jgi:hypothetical protein
MQKIIAILVLTVVGVALAGLFLPMVNRRKASAERARCQDNLRRICLQYILPEMEATKAFPAGTVDVAKLPPDQRVSWIIPGLGRLGHAELLNQIDATLPWNSEGNQAAGRAFLLGLACPSILNVRPDDGQGPLHYPGIAGVGVDAATKPADAPGAGMFRYKDPTHIADVKDGLANTLMLMETSVRPAPWIAGGSGTVRPLDPTQRPYLGIGRPFGGAHLAGANAALADGSGRFIADTIDPRVLELMAGIADPTKPDNSQ